MSEPPFQGRQALRAPLTVLCLASTGLLAYAFWQQFRWRAIGVLLLLSFQALLIGILIFERSKRKRATDALRGAARLYDNTGETFFRSLTEHLSFALRVEYVAIGELSACGKRIKTVAVSAAGRNTENLEYELENTPCKEVLAKGRFVDRSDVQAHFPLPDILKKLSFQSYLGVALVDSSGKRLGVMSVMDCQPLKDIALAETTLDVFASRASAEMERLRSERELERSRLFTERIAKTIPNVLFVYDLVERRNVYVNDRSWEMLGYTADEVVAMGDSFLPCIMHPEDLAKLPKLAEFYAKARDGEVFENLFRMRHKNGQWRWVHRCATIFTKTADGRPLQMLGTATDITDLKTAEEELSKLSAHLLSAQDRERRRIARELHDGTAQNLFAISLNLSTLRQRGVSPAASNILSDCETLCDASLKELRTMSYLLHPPMLDQGGLLPALRWLADGLGKRSGLKVKLDAPAGMDRLPMHLERDLFRIIQEALSNVFRHSGSTTATVSLERHPREVILQIRDFGRGMSNHTTGEENGDEPSPGLGILSMRERLRHAGGRLEIQSNEQGTTIIATVPFQEESADPIPRRKAANGS
jgi:PAS domain S-box-containing protein